MSRRKSASVTQKPALEAPRVCNSDEADTGEADDPLVSCGCGLVVHVHRYGAKYLNSASPELARTNPVGALKCALCPGGIFDATRRAASAGSANSDNRAMKGTPVAPDSSKKKRDATLPTGSGPTSCVYSGRQMYFSKMMRTKTTSPALKLHQPLFGSSLVCSAEPEAVVASASSGHSDRARLLSAPGGDAPCLFHVLCFARQGGNSCRRRATGAPLQGLLRHPFDRLAPQSEGSPVQALRGLPGHQGRL